ncbi:hypothetical protein Bca4012_085652 [Brassica carinata]
MAVRSTSGTMNGMLLWRDATRKSWRKPQLLRRDDPISFLFVHQGLLVNNLWSQIKCIPEEEEAGESSTVIPV